MRPVPGRPYTAAEVMSVEDVATQAYGTPANASLLWDANPDIVGDIEIGQTIIIPGEVPAVKLTGKQPDEMTFIVDGLEIPMVSARIIRTMDTGTSGWTGRMPWTPGLDSGIDKATRPYGYVRAAAYIGNTLQVSGRLYVVEPEKTDTGITKTLTGFSFTADSVDSNLQPPYAYSGVTLEQLGAKLAAPHGFNLKFEVGTGGKFDEVTGHESDTEYAFLSKLANERGFLIGDTPEGDMIFHRAKTEGTPVGTISESLPMATGWKAKYDGRKRFRIYNCISAAGAAAASLLWTEDAPEAQPVTVSSIDPSVPLGRFQNFRADDTTPGNVEDAARWRRNKQYVEALTQPLPVIGWYAPNGELWQPNQLVTVISPTLGVPKGFTFLIRSVEFVLEDRRTTMLQLVPPQAYTKKYIEDIWTLG